MFLIPKSGFWVNFLEKMTAKSQFDCAAKIKPGFLKDFCFCCLTKLTHSVNESPLLDLRNQDSLSCKLGSVGGRFLNSSQEFIVVVLVVIMEHHAEQKLVIMTNALNFFFLPSQKPNLILNVDGLIGVAFVDMLRHCGSFTR